MKDHLNEAAEGRGRIVAIGGEPGIGKTRLCDEVARDAMERGFVTAWAHCAAGSDTPPYWAWRQLIGQVRDQQGAKEDLVDPFNELPLDASATASTDDTLLDRARWTLFEGVARFFAQAAQERPLLLVLEDANAGDASTVSLARYLVAEFRRIRAVALITLDESAARRDSSLWEVLSSITRDTPAISLEALDMADSVELLGEALGGEPPAHLAAAVYEASGGNPLFIQEIARLLRSRGDLHRPDHSVGFHVSEGIRDVIRQRLSGIDTETRVLLSIASVLGRTFDVRVLSEIAEMPHAEVIGLLDDAAEQHLISAIDAVGGYAFDHVLIRETLYEDLTALRRMKLHRAAAEAVERVHTHNIDDHLGELAHHWFKSAQAGNPPTALDYSVRAAARAVAEGAYEEASRLYQRALKVADQAGVGHVALQELQEKANQVSALVVGPSPEEAPSETEADPHVFRNEGDFWTLSYGGETVRLKGVKGLRYLTHLLANPGREMHALDLINAVDASAAPRPLSRPMQENLAVADEAGAPLLDAKAKEAYRKRLQELQLEADEADAFNDPERAARAREEIEALVAELGRAVGLHGRDRTTASSAERARIAITKSIREAMRRIAAAHPALGEHLDATIRTGVYCSYRPDPRLTVEWLT